jgi:hypothetical protein
MNIAILQLSDIHMVLKGNTILSKHGRIHNAIQEHIFELDHLYVTVTGDSAYSGNYDEYMQVIWMLEEITTNIKTIKDIDISYIIIPGNHDCNFTLGKPSIRNVIIKNIQEGKIDKIDDVIIDELVAPQEEYFNFLNYFESQKNKVVDDKIFRRYFFQIGEYGIIFNCLNSSWISVLKEKPGNMYFPINNYKDQLESTKADLVISAVHHPQNWYFPENGRDIGKVLEENSDLILTGHEHVSTASKKEDFDGNVTQYIEGGVLQKSDDSGKSQFNFIMFNLNSKLQKLVRYSWTKTYYTSIYETEWSTFDRSKSLNKSPFLLSKEFSVYLNDPGITIKHPQKANVILEDIYMYPDGRIVEINEKSGKAEEIINLKQLTSYREDFNLFVLGSEKSGKTAFCKTIFNYHYNHGLTPVYINGLHIKDNTLADFNKLVYKNYSYQYSGATLENYKQLEMNKKVIIIDDLDKSKQNSKSLLELLRNIKKAYPNIILTGNEIMKYSDLLNDDETEVDILEKFNKFEIMQFGHLGRAHFINKWNALGQVNNLTDKELLEKNDKTAAIINVVIGNNYVPSYPFFLLILLQTAESGLPHNNKDSSYGYYYELLITQSFMNINMQHNEIDAYYTYIAELAYHFFEKDIYEITKTEFKEFNNWLGREYDLTHEFDKITKKLLDSSVLELHNNSYRFKYNYTYYYFVAKYFAVKINEEKIKKTISEMCTNVYIEEYANILMFLTHLSKDPFILYEIHNQAQKIFEEFSPTTLENDIISLNNLAIEVPKLVYQNIEVNKHREDQLIAKDEIERSRQEVAVDRERKKRKENVMDLAAKLNVAFKTIEILGQILRNYYGSIKATEKYFLTEEAYFVGLRTLNSFLSVISNNVNNIASKIQRVIEQQDANLNKPDIEDMAGKLLFNLCCAISYHTIKKVSESIGSEDLYATYRRISDVHDSTAVKLIEISIKLDQSRSLPYNDIRVLKESAEGNVMATSLLKVLVINHLYMFDTDYRDKQRICALLGIPMAKQRSIDLLSTQKKNK